MPMNFKDYARNWKNLSKSIRERAGNRCELCAAPNGKRILRDATGRWHDIVDILEQVREVNDAVKIILTVHHVNFDRSDNRRVNLLALCQRCHLKLDIGEKLKKRARKIPEQTHPMFGGDDVR